MSSLTTTWLRRSRPWLLFVSILFVAIAGVFLALTDGAGSPAHVLGERFGSFTAGGNGHGNNGNGNGNGGPSGNGSPGKAFTLTVQHPIGNVAPGAPVVLTVRVTNTNGQAMILTAASGQVTGVDKVGCDYNWFHIADWSPTDPPTEVPGNGYVDIPLTLSMDDLSTNQDDCKSTDDSQVNVSFKLSATGQQA